MNWLTKQYTDGAMRALSPTVGFIGSTAEYGEEIIDYSMGLPDCIVLLVCRAVHVLSQFDSRWHAHCTPSWR